MMKILMQFESESTKDTQRTYFKMKSSYELFEMFDLVFDLKVIWWIRLFLPSFLLLLSCHRRFKILNLDDFSQRKSQTPKTFRSKERN